MTVDIDREDWLVVTKTRNGTVSLLRNLTLKRAVQVYHSLDPYRNMVPGAMYMGRDGDIEERQLLGPEGWDGCQKAASHDYQDVTEELCDRGPNKGRTHRSGTCRNCGSYLFEWIDVSAAQSEAKVVGATGIEPVTPPV